ncbi:MAG: hypothetical protein ACRDP7_06505 [Trebonia sp.]
MRGAPLARARLLPVGCAPRFLLLSRKGSPRPAGHRGAPPARYRRRAARARLPRVAGRRSRAPASRLPPGLSVGKGGTVGETITPAAAPKAAVTYRVADLVKNGAGATATVAFSWRVSPA